MEAVFDEGPARPCPAPFNMVAHVLGPARATPDKVALAVVGATRSERWSYATLEAAVLGTASGLLARGLVAGDRVLMRLGNTLDFPVTYLACIAVGLVPVPTSPQLTEPEITRIAREIGPELVVAGDGIALHEGDAPVLSTDELRALRRLPAASYDLGKPDRPAYIIYTSGTSGVPRAVVHAHRAIWARRMMWGGWYGLTAADRLMHAGAFNWTYTLGTGLMDPWAVGAAALIPEAGVGPETLGLLLARHDATIFAAAPGVYRQMLHRPMPALPKLRHGLSAGEKLPEATRAAWREATGTAIHEAYGMSECSTFISGAPDRPPAPGTLGRPQPGRRVAILGPGGPVARGEPGTIAVAADDPGLMLGYLGAKEETAARFRGGWFLTGDTGAMAADGSIAYLGRDDDMMNAGGFRVSPIEVESALNAHPEVHDCACAEVRVKADATVIAAFYVAGHDLDEGELQAFLADRLARYKTPRLFERVAAVPRGANNKILRRALRQRYEAAHDQA